MSVTIDLCVTALLKSLPITQAVVNPIKVKGKGKGTVYSR